MIERMQKNVENEKNFNFIVHQKKNFEETIFTMYK